MALFPASASDLPKDAFLAAYKADHDNFTDCFAVRIDQEVPLSEYVEAFYTT